MSLSSAMSLAQSGLNSINRQLQTISGNVANAETPGYTRKTLSTETVIARGEAFGIRTGNIERVTDAAVQSSMWKSAGDVSNYQTMKNGIQQVGAIQGSPSDGSSLGGLLGILNDSFVSLKASPSDSTLQSSVVESAAAVARRLNELTTTITQSRQQAQDQLLTEIDGLNADIKEVSSLTDLIKSTVTAGGSGADIEDKRDQLISSISQRVGLKVTHLSDGGLMMITAGGQQLPISSNPTFSIGSSTIGPSSYYGSPSGTIPGIKLNGVDVTAGMKGGSIGALITLRDSTLPRMQGEFDEAAQKMAYRFDEQGLTLFSDSSGAVPPGGMGPPNQNGYIGFAGDIQVNPAVKAAPRLVRDGTHSVAGSGTGPSAFTPNPVNGPSSFGTMIDRAVQYALGTEVSAGNQQPSLTTSGLGPSGTLSSSFVSSPGIVNFVVSVVSAQASEGNTIGSRLNEATSLNNLLQTKYQGSVGVNLDAEMSALISLQNSYAANAKVIGAMQNLWDSVINMIR